MSKGFPKNALKSIKLDTGLTFERLGLLAKGFI